MKVFENRFRDHDLPMPRFENRFWDLTSRVTPTVHCMRAAMLIAPPLFVPSQLGPMKFMPLYTPNCRARCGGLPRRYLRPSNGWTDYVAGRTRILPRRSHRHPHDVFNPFFDRGSFLFKHESKIGILINFEAQNNPKTINYLPRAVPTIEVEAPRVNG